MTLKPAAEENPAPAFPAALSRQPFSAPLPPKSGKAGRAPVMPVQRSASDAKLHAFLHLLSPHTAMKPLLLAAACCLLPLSVLAQQNCDQPKDDFDGLYCLNKIYIQTDAELNKAYKDLAPRLSPEGKAKLKQTQLGWLEERNSSCSRKIDSGFYVNLSCATRTTRDRLQFLQERARECKSSGCLPSKF